MMLRNFREALRNSPYGWIDDVLALTGPWGFDPADIRVPVLLWHAAKDVFSPPPTRPGSLPAFHARGRSSIPQQRISPPCGRCPR